MNWLHGFQFLTCAFGVVVLMGLASNTPSGGWVLLFVLAGTGWAVLA